MGKSDQKAAKGMLNENRTTAQSNLGSGIRESGERAGQLATRSDLERSKLNETYTGFSGSDQQRYINELGSALPGGGSSGGGGGGGGKAAGNIKSGDPDYVTVWNELMGKEGGFDPTRLGNITDVAGKLRNTRENYKGSEEAIAGLMGIGRTGGVTDDEKNQIMRQYLQEAEQTGGYKADDVANIRSRANAATPAFYQNMQENLERSRGAGNFGPGIDRTGFKLAREAAQQQGNTARDTEIGIADAIRSGRMDASKFLSQQGLGLAELTSKNKLEGYGKGGELDITKNKAIEEALGKAGSLDLDTQQLINQSRLGASTSKAQDARAKQQIAAASSAASAARADANRRWASQMAQEDRFFGAKGLSDTYTASPKELEFNQNLLRDYRNDLTGSNQKDLSQRIDIGYIPGIGSSIRQGIGVASDIAGLGASVMTGGLSNVAMKAGKRAAGG